MLPTAISEPSDSQLVPKTLLGLYVFRTPVISTVDDKLPVSNVRRLVNEVVTLR